MTAKRDDTGKTHPTRELRRMASGHATASESRRAVRHLLAGCPRCRRTLACLLALPLPGEGRRRAESAPLPGIEGAVDRAIEAALATNRQLREEDAAAARLVAELEAHPPARAQMLLTGSRRFRTTAVCELLIERAVDSRHEDPAATLRWAEAATTVADLLDGPDTRELRARARMELANARRITGDLASSERDFATAEEHLRAAGSPPWLEATLRFLESSLRSHQRRFAEALELAGRAHRLFSRAGDERSAADALVKISLLQADAGNLEGGLQAAWEALQLLGPHADYSALLPGIHNLLLLLADAGAHQAAASLAAVAQPIYEATAGELDLIRFAWLRARILIRSGHLEEAGQLLEQVRVRFAIHDLAYEVAVASLDLAEVYARRGETARLRELAGDMLPVFQRLGVARETIASLALLQQALARDAGTLAVIERLVAKVESVRPVHGLSL